MTRGKVKVESTRLLLDDFFQVEEAILRHQLSDGSMSQRVRRLCFERGDSVAALVVHRDRQNCILVRQFRYPAYKRGDGWLLEIPAGGVEEGESPSQAVRRELREEIGYRVEELRPLTAFLPSPGGSSERILIYFAVVDGDGASGAGPPDELEVEDLEIEELPLTEIAAALASGRITDGKTLFALTWLQLRLAHDNLPREGTDHAES